MESTGEGSVEINESYRKSHYSLTSMMKRWINDMTYPLLLLTSYGVKRLVRSRTRAHIADMGSVSFTGNRGQSVLSTAPLFLLNLTSTTGENVEVAIMSTDNAARLAKELGRKYGFSDDQCRMLRLTLDRELEARLGK
uniref:WS_DGAT_C domain-containing protein n=1 Tax=Heterorhabditis bacteriophora TaxID=37862 RepID=A0A1I7XNM7_HETBA